MSFLFAALIAAAPLAQTTPAPAPAPAPAAAPAAATPAAATKFNLDTPIETLVADAAAKKVLDTDMGADITTNPSYDQFKGMSFNQVAPYAPDKLPATLLAKIGADLATIK